MKSSHRYFENMDASMKSSHRYFENMDARGKVKGPMEQFD
jgi:hypothetical protein